MIGFVSEFPCARPLSVSFHRRPRAGRLGDQEVFDFAGAVTLGAEGWR